MVKDIFLHNGGQDTSHIQTAQNVFDLLKGPVPGYPVLKCGDNLFSKQKEIWPKM